MPEEPASVGEGVPASTAPRVRPSARDERRMRLVRRVGLGVVAVVVVLGLVGAFGVRSTTTRRTDGGLDVALTHARVARPALAVPYRLRIHRAGGFRAPIEVRITSAYLEALDENGAHPEPDATTADGRDTVWTFAPPDGEVLTVWLDTRVDPGVQWRRDGRTTVTNGADAVTVDHAVWIMP